jgi:hypothetical protein
MADPTIHSSGWTGPIDEQVLPYRAQPNRIFGWPRRPQPGIAPTPAERRRARLLALVLLSPLLLFAAWYAVHMATTDTMIADHREWLKCWAMAAIGWFALDCLGGKPANPTVRILLLALVFGATVLFAGWYSYTVLKSHADARPLKAERAYELNERCGRNCSYFVHQRADGTSVEGMAVGEPVPYGATCTLVQRLEGDYGFSWIRVLERSPPSAHEVIWPIRREDCFSDKPLATLRR